MKITNIYTNSFFNYNLIKLNLLQSKIYKKKTSKDSLNNFLEQIEIYFKQALRIVFEYHNSGYKILFIGFSELNKISHSKNHQFLEEKLWVNGILSTKISPQNSKKFKTIKKPDLLKSLFNLNNKPDLIVIYSENLEINVLKEAYKFQIPIIVFGMYLINKTNFDYEIPGNFYYNFKKLNNICNILLYSILKRSYEISQDYIPDAFFFKKKYIRIYKYSKYKNRFFLKKNKKKQNKKVAKKYKILILKLCFL